MLAAPEDVEIRAALVGRLAEARGQTDKLFDLVRPDSLYERPIPERHRIIFYLGHLEAFDWNLLHPHITRSKPFDPEFDRLFAFGIDPHSDELHFIERWTMSPDGKTITSAWTLTDPKIFKATFQRNVTYSRKDASDERQRVVENVCQNVEVGGKLR